MSLPCWRSEVISCCSQQRFLFYCRFDLYFHFFPIICCISYCFWDMLAYYNLKSHISLWKIDLKIFDRVICPLQTDFWQSYLPFANNLYMQLLIHFKWTSIKVCIFLCKNSSRHLYVAKNMAAMCNYISPFLGEMYCFRPVCPVSQSVFASQMVVDATPPTY